MERLNRFLSYLIKEAQGGKFRSFPHNRRDILVNILQNLTKDGLLGKLDGKFDGIEWIFDGTAEWTDEAKNDCEFALLRTKDIINENLRNDGTCEIPKNLIRIAKDIIKLDIGISINICKDEGYTVFQVDLEE